MNININSNSRVDGYNNNSNGSQLYNNRSMNRWNK